MKKINRNFFYNVYVEDTSDNYKELIATFKSFSEAEEFVTNNETDINETVFNVAYIYKFSYGSHYGIPEEKYIYKFDRKTGMYYFIERITKLSEICKSEHFDA